MIEVAEPRKIAKAFTYVRRSDLTRGGGSGRPQPLAFLRELRSFDPGLEPHWNIHIERWVLYRVRSRGVVRSEDMLIKEFVVQGLHGEHRELGGWLVEYLRRNDKIRLYSTTDPGYADRQYIRELKEEEGKRDNVYEKKARDAAEGSANEFRRYGIDDLKHFPQGALSPTTRRRRQA